jgi:hypothetical protein
MSLIPKTTLTLRPDRSEAVGSNGIASIERLSLSFLPTVHAGERWTTLFLAPTMVCGGAVRASSGILRITFALLSLWLCAGPGVVTAQSGDCRFSPGFAELRSLLGPDRVGDCIGPPQDSPNGDVTQQTTKGTLVWRKVDGIVGFTDGVTTWLNGPNGVQGRPNHQRLQWEVQGSSPGGPASNALPSLPQPITVADFPRPVLLPPRGLGPFSEFPISNVVAGRDAESGRSTYRVEYGSHDSVFLGTYSDATVYGDQGILAWAGAQAFWSDHCPATGTYCAYSLLSGGRGALTSEMFRDLTINGSPALAVHNLYEFHLWDLTWYDEKAGVSYGFLLHMDVADRYAGGRIDRGNLAVARQLSEIAAQFVPLDPR